MAVRKKRARGKNTKFKAVKRVLSQIAKIGQKPYRAVRASLWKIGAVLFACTGVLKKGFRLGFQRFIRLPHALRIVLVYLLTVMLVGGIFVWRTAQLRNLKPDPDQFSFDWADDWEKFHLVEGDAEEDSETEKSEPAVSEPDPVSEQPSESAQPDYPGAGPGIWPVNVEDREILFEFRNIIIEDMGNFTVRYKYSEGIYVKAEPGAKVRAIWGGAVTSIIGIGYPPSAHSVTIKHDNGIEAYYRSLTDVHVQIEDRVESGSCLGILGSSNTYKGYTYLYLEMKENGNYIDPCSYLPDAALISF